MGHETFVDPAIILGHVAAHEIGHLLLGTNSHSPGGIMRAHWRMEELARAKKGLLLFTKSQSHRMTEKLCVPWQEGNGHQQAAQSSQERVRVARLRPCSIPVVVFSLPFPISQVGNKWFQSLLGAARLGRAERGLRGVEPTKYVRLHKSRSIGEGERSEP
jgi:hypothetical protein